MLDSRAPRAQETRDSTRRKEARRGPPPAYRTCPSTRADTADRTGVETAPARRGDPDSTRAIDYVGGRSDARGGHYGLSRGAENCLAGYCAQVRCGRCPTASPARRGGPPG